MENKGVKQGNNRRPTQCGRLLAHMRLFGGVSTMEAITTLAIINPAARVLELKAQGIAVKTEMRAAVNKFGERVRYAYYTLEKGGKTQ